MGRTVLGARLVARGTFIVVGQDWPMTSPVRGLIVCVPTASLDDYVGAVEVLIQEGFTRFALPAGAEAFRDVVMIFGRRATFGALRVGTAEQAAGAVEAGATFVLADVADDEVAAATGDVPCYLAAMTPTEVRAVYAAPSAAGALIYPADVVGHALAARLTELGLVDRAIPMGGIGAYAAGEWLKAGAQAVCIDSTLLGDAFAGGSLTSLRDRCGSFIAVEKRQEA
ncbi:MAG TPA: hypothetical protein K8V15_04165 [Tessaracoccus flavescens]|uniref:Aldolase n=1 Tax=Tessaracoccus flavescens TaxID=399497 RepID=A0A921ENY2_9ACTN|nr:hypothetical protein [Tessaracoccus flavescens]